MGLTRDWLAALGLITYNFQNFEMQMQFLAWCLISENQEIGQIVTCQMAFRTLCDLLASLFRQRTNDAELIAELDRLLASAATIEQERNQVIHSSWLVADNPNAMVKRFKITARRGRGIKQQYQSTGTADLSKFATSIRKASDEFRAFMIKTADKGVIKSAGGPIKWLGDAESGSGDG